MGATMRPSHPQVRRHILDSGRALITHRGFVAVGLNEILKTADVPKGSFYHYFGSKEQYGRELLEQYVADYAERLDQLFNGSEANARDKLLLYWSEWQREQLEADGPDKCLVVKLSAEVADLSDDMRIVLRDGVARLIARIAALIEEGGRDGSLSPALDARELAQTLYQLWLGAALVTKLRRDGSALAHAMSVTQTMLRSA
ncbi:transcriptional regulator, TetR family [Paraburkholderia phenazinium]|jgi:TetR/AcrR family transcriptional repressor of nem operon|uniref:Transcriptional regulator, TetR family n=2 Tax=Paraburkholderia phenazinium TaxID=60549 RepID=A0A1G8GPC5_9BURK|nr:transcriptional regulator, TetR family [Paraburkholderia phenazinium]